MILLNMLEKEDAVGKETYGICIKLIASFAPHVAEELWAQLGNPSSVHLEMWPEFDPSKLLNEKVIVAIQVSGKLRGTIETSRDLDEESLISLVKQGEMYKKHVGNEVPKKVIIIKNRVVNIVI